MIALRGAALAAGCVALSCAAACVVIPKRGKLYGPGGNVGSLDLRFLKSGATPREEVISRLQIVDVHLSDNAIFWGRWKREWNIYWAAAGGGQTSATAGSGKETVWRRRNLLVAFDSDGKVSEFRAAGDSDLLRELGEFVRRADKPPELMRTELVLTSLEGERILLRDGRVSFGGIRTGGPRFECEFSKLTALKVAAESAEDRVALRLETSISKRAQRRFSLMPVRLYDLVRFAVANGLERILTGEVPNGH